jgi:hypothetical protein
MAEKWLRLYVEDASGGGCAGWGGRKGPGQQGEAKKRGAHRQGLAEEAAGVLQNQCMLRLQSSIKLGFP